jgi:hypothetical protein
MELSKYNLFPRSGYIIVERLPEEEPEEKRTEFFVPEEIEEKQEKYETYKVVSDNNSPTEYDKYYPGDLVVCLAGHSEDVVLPDERKITLINRNSVLCFLTPKDIE